MSLTLPRPWTPSLSRSCTPSPGYLILPFSRFSCPPLQLELGELLGKGGSAEAPLGLRLSEEAVLELMGEPELHRKCV